MTAILVALGVALTVLAVPVAFMLAGASMGAIVFGAPQLPLNLVGSRQLDGIHDFVFVAIPLFVLAGELMNHGGIAKRLIGFAEACFGWIPGGLGVSVVCATILFSGTIGSKLGEAAAMGTTVFPGLQEAKYPRRYSVALVGSASAMGELVPPAVLMIILASLTNASVARLFAAGLIPALLMAACIISLIILQASRMGLASTVRFSLRRAARAFVLSIPALAVPVTIFGGIFSGLVTATEAGALAVLAALVAAAIYRELPLRRLPRIVLESSLTSASIIFILGIASILSYLLAIANVPQVVTSWILDWSRSPVVFMAFAAVVFITLGSVLEGLPAVVIFLPVFLPVMVQLGIPPLQFLTVVVAAVGVGLFMPPFGIGTAMLASIGGVGINEVLLPTAVFMAAELCALLGMILLPQFSVALPSLLPHGL